MSEQPPPSGAAHEGGGLVGATVDVFFVLELIGRGGMGEVYRARDIRLDRLVALKIVNPLYARDAEFVGRFEREARATSAINHPNVAQIYWTGRWYERPYYAMELVGGHSLADVLRDHGRLTGLKCLSYMKQAAQGLAAALEKGIVHRDIKPANLMVSSEGQLKIVDFGLARRLTGEHTLTQSDCVLGTPRYMAPEQALAQPIDHRSDIYSLGATFYHLLAGVPPFDADTPVALMMKHVTEPLPPLKDRNPLVPQAVSEIVVRMLAKRPEERYQTYEELLADLDRVQAGRRATARRPAPPASPPTSPHARWAWLTNALVAVALVAATVTTVVVVLGGRRRETPAPTPTAAPAVEPARREPGLRPTAPPVPVATEGPGASTGWVPPEDEVPAAAPAVGPTSAPPAAQPPSSQPPDFSPANVVAMAFNAKTLATMRRLATVLEVANAETDEYPTSLADVEKRYELLPEDRGDGWGNEIRYERLGPRSYRLTSAGADAAFGSEDDVVIENGRIVKGEPRIPEQFLRRP